MSLICMKMILQAELIPLRLVLKERHKGTRKWPITLASMRFSTYTDFVIDVAVSVFVAVAKRCS